MRGLVPPVDGFQLDFISLYGSQANPLSDIQRVTCLEKKFKEKLEKVGKKKER